MFLKFEESAAFESNTHLLAEPRFNKSASFFKYKINRLYSVIPLANYIKNFTDEKTLPYAAEISCDDVYFLGEWAGDNSYIGTDRLGTSLDGNALSELIENDNEFKESDVWTVVEGYEYPQLKNNPHLHSKEVIPALKNYSFETAVSEGIYSIKYNTINVKIFQFKSN